MPPRASPRDPPGSIPPPPAGPAPAAAAARAVARATDPDPDGDLARRAASGERAAFEALLRRHYDRMHRVAWRMTGSRHDAEDVVQEVCCALVGRIGSFKGEARVSTWLVGIVLNACRDLHRRRTTLARLKEGLAVLARLGPAPDGRDLFRRTWLASALARLDPALRETVVLVVGEGLTHAEAGQALGVAETTVSWRLHEARRRLATDPEERHGA
ncbi:hypothetical protein OPKNFCMD_4198 [Methylobacterium crusticola]|uniref:RNA polymerase sigma factor n=1 Tax=Methylobacterium crusticola TaxID=1697972 RepID=A0ABQ4R2R8_9HYPH|nr:sigma-70 family RNA polymerase sigma factor [Methylobacterium crusticola]GJD51444.1 hypothetical protein OPKNFCMD_4198 [Methylobacterium crusticola]